MKRRIILTGTHITPALELINQLKNDDKNLWEIWYIGRKYNSSVTKEASNESLIVPKTGVKFVGIRCGKFDRRWLLNTIAGIPDLIFGIWESLRLVFIIKPEVIVSFGGYVSVPVMFAGYFKGIPSVTHEQTLTTSLSTRINSWFAKKVALTFENEEQLREFGSKGVVTGNLIRREIFENRSKQMEKKLGTIKGRVVLVTAGNQGSAVLNDVVVELAAEDKGVTWIHQTGRSQYQEIVDRTKGFRNYFPFDYIEGKDIGWVFKRADVVVSRGGANTAQDIVALGKKAVMIPLPVSQQDEQRKNCRWVHMKQPKKTIILEQKDLNGGTLMGAVEKLLGLKDDSKKVEFLPNLELMKLIYEMV